jgi:hypothetical protein
MQKEAIATACECSDEQLTAQGLSALCPACQHEYLALLNEQFRQQREDLLNSLAHTTISPVEADALRAQNEAAQKERNHNAA